MKRIPAPKPRRKTAEQRARRHLQVRLDADDYLMVRASAAVAGISTQAWAEDCLLGIAREVMGYTDWRTDQMLQSALPRPPEYLTQREATRLLGVSVDTLQRWGAAGPPRFKRGRTVRYSRTALHQWCEEQTAKTAAG